MIKEKLQSVLKWTKKKIIGLLVTVGILTVALAYNPVPIPQITAPENNTFKIGVQNYQTAFAQDITEDRALQYKLDDKFISFKPTGVYFDGKKALNINQVNRLANKYEGVFGTGIDLEMKTSNRMWSKLITIQSNEVLDLILEGTEFIEIEFEVETNFIIDGWNRKDDFEVIDIVRVGDYSYLEPANAWDSYSEEVCEIIEEEEFCETLTNRIQIKSWFSNKGQKLYYTKQISIDWLKVAQYPVYFDADVTYGTAETFLSMADTTSLNNQDLPISKIDTNKFVLGWRTYYGGTPNQEETVAVVGTVSGTEITWGDPVLVDNEAQSGSSKFWTDVCAIDTDKFVFTWTNDSLLDDGYARGASVSTRTITLSGTSKEIETGDMEHASCAKLDTDKFIVCYDDETNSDTGTCVVGTVSGTTVANGTPDEIDGNNGAIDYYLISSSVAQVGTDKFVLAFTADDAGYDNSLVLAGTVSGTSMTFGTAVEFEATKSDELKVVVLDTDKFVIAWWDTVNNKGYVRAGTISGTAVTLGSEVEFSGSITYNIGMTAHDSTHFLLAYSDGGDSYKGKTRYCSVDFSDRTITLGDVEEFWGADTVIIANSFTFGNKEMNIALIDTDKVAISFIDDSK